MSISKCPTIKDRLEGENSREKVAQKLRKQMEYLEVSNLEDERQKCLFNAEGSANMHPRECLYNPNFI